MNDNPHKKKRTQRDYNLGFKLAVAWTVIKNCGKGDNHPFTFPIKFSVAGGDSYGNYTRHFEASKGERWEMVRDNMGDVLQLSGSPSSNPLAVEVANTLQSPISANCFKDGKLLAKETGIDSGRKATFEFSATIWIGVVSQIEEGDVLNAAILATLSTEINLFNLASSDILMTGGGTGPFKFALENMVNA